MKHEPIDALFMSIPKDYSSMRCSAGKDPVPRAQCEHEAVRLFHYEVLDMPSIMFQVPRIVVYTLYGNAMVAALCSNHCLPELPEGWKELSFSEFKALESVWEVQEE